MLAPDNGHVACKAWGGAVKQTGRDRVHLALHREDPRRSLPRHPGATAWNPLLAHLVGP